MSKTSSLIPNMPVLNPGGSVLNAGGSSTTHTSLAYIDKSYNFHSISDWRQLSFNPVPSYLDILDQEEYSKLSILSNFSEKLTTSLVDMDGEFVKIVDENFWELI